MPEYVGNLHIHSTYSDGDGSPADIAEAALLAGLDFITLTDHNLWLENIEGYYGNEERGYVLVLSGEEVHDRSRLPQCNHLLVYGAEQDVAPHAHDLSTLIKTVNDLGGLTFIAHPDDCAVPWAGEPPIPWLDRDVEGFTGLEIWNYMSRFKNYVQIPRATIRAVFRPEEVIVGPHPNTLMLWDQLLQRGQDVVGIGSADAHAKGISFGPLHHVIFPYDFLFNCVNTHVLTKSPLTGDVEQDKRLVYQTLRQGRAFVGYDLIGSTRGFIYSAQGQNTSAIMGEHIPLGHGVTLQVHAPARARIKIIRYGEVVADEPNVENLTHIVRSEGAYRAEVWFRYHGRERAWILSNPIYVDANPNKTLAS